MKMRLILVAATLLLFCVSARADSTITVDLVGGATCETCLTLNGNPPDPVVTLNVQFTVVLTTGTFYDYDAGAYLTRPEYEIASMSGTLDGEQMSLVPPLRGDGSWLNSNGPPYGQNFYFGATYFTVNGPNCSSALGSVSYLCGAVSLMDWDGAYSYLEGIPMEWTSFAAVPSTAPEPASFALMVVGILAIVGVRTGCKRRSGFLVPSEK